MNPITPGERHRAFYRVRGCAEALLHDLIITEEEFRFLIDRAVRLFGHPDYNLKLMEQNEKKQ